MSDQNVNRLYYVTGALVLFSLVLLLRSYIGRLSLSACQPKDKTVVVTGGCSGLGHEIASIYRSNGCKVAVIDLKDENDLSFPLTTASRYYKCDVSRKEEVELVMEKLEVEVS